MAKSFQPIVFDPAGCRSEILELKSLLDAKAELSERQDVQPFFKSHEQIAAFLGTYSNNIGPATDIVFEYPIVGNFVADLIVGNRALGAYCFVEFEDGRDDSIFKKTTRSMTDWSPRFEHGFSQIVDWFSHLDDLKKTDLFKKDFGKNYPRFSALLIIGRDSGITDYDRIRLDWRCEKVLIDSQSVVCVTFDRLFEDLDRRLRVYTGS